MFQQKKTQEEVQDSGNFFIYSVSDDEDIDPS